MFKHGFAFVCALLLVGCDISSQVSTEERKMFLTLEDYQHDGIDVRMNKNPVFRRIVNHVYGTAEFTYIYDDQAHGLFLQNTLQVVNRFSLATRMTERAQREAALIGMKSNGVTDEPLPHQHRYGKQSYVGLLRYKGEPVGNIFSFAVDNKIYLMLCSGIYYEDGDAFHRLVADKVAAVQKLSL